MVAMMVAMMVATMNTLVTDLWTRSLTSTWKGSDDRKPHCVQHGFLSATEKCFPSSIAPAPPKRAAAALFETGGIWKAQLAYLTSTIWRHQNCSRSYEFAWAALFVLAGWKTLLPAALTINQNDGLWVTGHPEGWSPCCASCDQSWNCVEKVATKDGSFWVKLYQASEKSIATSAETDVEGWRNEGIFDHWVSVKENHPLGHHLQLNAQFAVHQESSKSSSD